MDAKKQKHIMLLSIHTCVRWDQENRRCNTSTKSRTHCLSEQESESESENESRKRERERERERERGRWRGKRDRERVMEKDSLNDTHRAGTVP